MDDIELKNIESRQPLMRSLSRSDSYTQEDKIDTPFGSLLVAVQGERNRPAIVTYHDIGLNHVSNFQAFFNFMDTRILMQSFCVYHINAPGQEEDAPPLPDGYTFPDMEQLAEMILSVLKFYGLKHFVGFGVGAGANILCRFALAHPDCVDGLFLINCCCTPSSWTEWGYQKLNSMYLRSSGMTASTQEYLMWHHFGKVTEERNHDLIQVYRQYFNKSINAKNLSMFIDTFVKRGDLGIIREIDFNKKKGAKNFSCHVLLLAGALSPHLEDTVTMNSRLDPSNSTWMKLSDCGMVLEEQPAKVSEALRLFLQGLGYGSAVGLGPVLVPNNHSPILIAVKHLVDGLGREALNQFRRKSSSASSCGEVPSLTSRKMTQSRQNSLEEEDATGNKREVHIVENPINQHSVTC